MIFTETVLKGACVVEPEPLSDERGFFARVWCHREFGDKGLIADLKQSNISFNHRAGTLRGLHYQVAPYQETKLIRCTRGAIFDVIIDLRRESETFCHWFGIELTEDNYRMLYVPKDFAHGYLTLTDKTEVAYHVSQFYTPGAERGIRWDDPLFEVRWPMVPVEVSNKDGNWANYNAEE